MIFPWEKENVIQIWTWPQVFWINVFGWWVEDIKDNRMKKIAKKLVILEYMVNVWFISAVLVNVIVIIRENGFMESLFVLFASMPAMLGATKIICLIKYRKILRNAMDELDRLTFETMKMGTDLVLEKKVRRHYARGWILFYFLLIIGSLITIHWISRPLLLAMSGIKTTIVATYPPMSETWTQVFVIYTLQAFNIMTLGHALYMFDNFYFGMAECILVQFTILKHNLYNMNITRGKAGNVSLKFCADHHVAILKICEALKVSSKFVILFQSFQTVLLLCSGVFQLSMGKINNMQVLINLLEITLIIVFIIYWYCWYSNEISFQSKNILTSMYMSNWGDGNVKDRKSLILMMTMTSHPVVFGGILKIDLHTFLDILKTTFSYYNFLTAVDTTGK